VVFRAPDERGAGRGLVYGIGTDLWFDAVGDCRPVQTDPGKVAQADIVRPNGAHGDERSDAAGLDNAKTYLLNYYPRNFTNTMDTARLPDCRPRARHRLRDPPARRSPPSHRRHPRAAQRLFVPTHWFVVVGPADQIQLPGAEVVRHGAELSAVFAADVVRAQTSLLVVAAGGGEAGFRVACRPGISQTSPAGLPELSGRLRFAAAGQQLGQPRAFRLRGGDHVPPGSGTSAIGVPARAGP
jgi:hypothetical protein